VFAIKSEKDINGIMEKLRQGGSKQELGEYLKSKLNASQSKKLDEIINDENALNEILNSPKAKELLRRIKGEDDGQH